MSGIREQKKRSIDSEISETLCRVTTMRYLVDPAGYLLSHETKLKQSGGYTQNINGFDQRSLPLIHPDEWEVIARMFAWHRYKDHGSAFRLLTFDATRTNVVKIRPHGVLDHGEYFGIVHQHAIISDIKYTWVKDGRPMNISKSARENWPRIFAASKGYSPVPANQISIDTFKTAQK